MKSTVGVYETHDQAVTALKELQNAGIPTKHISVLGKAEKIDDHLHVTNQAPEVAEVSVGVVAGSVLGILTGVGIFAIPGLGFLFGAGALVGAFAGVEVGLLGGGLAAILTNIGIDKFNASKYENQLNEGKFVVVVHGDATEVKKAQEILHAHGTHLELDAHH